MSRQQLHDLLTDLETQRNALDPVDHEHQRRLDELISSLERQRVDEANLTASDANRAEENEAISNRITEMVTEYEADHPKITAVLNGIGRVLQSFKV